MHYYEVQPVLRRAAKLGVATYCSESPFRIGNVVRIQYGSKQTVGIVLQQCVKPNFKTKEITGLVSEQTLPSDLLKLAQVMSKYYPFDESSLYSLLLPNGAHKSRRGKAQKMHGKADNDQPKLTQDQSKALTQLGNLDDYSSNLLHGITGSGKTRVYFERAIDTINRGQDCIILVPEIALSSQLIDRAMKYIDAPIYRIDSVMTESENHKAWQSILEEDNPCVIIGPRSALFSPVKNLGLIVIDESHDQSYKQDQNPQYNALHVAAMRAKIAKAQLIMGSATPNVTEFWFSKSKHINLLELPNTVFDQADHSRIVIDTRKRDDFTRSTILSNPLLDHIHDALSTNKQAMLYVNRRGHSPIIKCSECDWRATCNTCTLPLVYHTSGNSLRCHVCNTRQSLVTKCPECNSIAIRYQGVGTQKLETEVKKLFPHAAVGRLDRDSDDKKSTPELLDRMHSGELDILIGTQMITKGFDFKQLAVVGIVNADSMLYLPDFRSGERAFQVIYQAIGRNDRLGEGGQTIIQTASPNHHAIQQAVKHDYPSFYESEIADRQRASFPPFSYILQITARRKTIEGASKTLNTIRKQIPKHVRALGPAPAMHAIQGKYHVWHLVLMSKQRGVLLEFAKQNYNKNLAFDLDPLDLL